MLCYTFALPPLPHGPPSSVLAHRPSPIAHRPSPLLNLVLHFIVTPASHRPRSSVHRPWSMVYGPWSAKRPSIVREAPVWSFTLDPHAGRDYILTRWLFLRLLGFVYLFAFASLRPQVLGLIASDGILP